MEGLSLVALQCLGSLAPGGALYVERLLDGVVHRDETAFVDVVGDWEKAAKLEFIEGLLMPRRRIVFAPA